MSFKDNFSWLLFNEEEHRYTDGTNREYTSVSNFIHAFEPDTFNESFIKQYAADRGLTPEYVKKSWAIKRDFSSVKGTEFHLWVETFIKEGLELTPVTPIVNEIELFKQYWKFRKKEIEVIDLELKIASKKYGIAGTIDCLARDRQTGLYLIQDWKTNKQIRTQGYNGNKFLKPFDAYDNCEFVKYSIQQGVYRLICEEELGLQFKETQIVHFNTSRGMAFPMVLLEVNKEIKEALNERVA